MMMTALSASSLLELNDSMVGAFLSCQNRGHRALYSKYHSTAISHQGSSRIEKNPISSSKQIEFVDFWGTSIKSDDNGQESHELPADRNLDRHDGELPPGSYLTHGSQEYNAKKACRIILALDWKQKNSKFETRPLDSGLVVKLIQECIAAGFQTFQLAPECHDVDIIGRVLRETPTYVDMHWVVKLDIPRQISVATIRGAVFDLLYRMQSESLDTLLVPYQCDLQSPYYLDILDVLQDMQRDGFIRSIGVENWPAELVQEAKTCDLSIDICQSSVNLLRLNQQDAISQLEITEWWTNPLAGNFLSDTFVGRSEPPSRARGWKDVKAWFDLKKKSEKSLADKYGKAESNKELWGVFQEKVHETLQQLSWKYEMSIATIILRWSLQEKTASKRSLNPSSVVYPLFLVEEPENHLARQLRDLRDVFRFELNDEDLGVLNGIAARPKPKPTSLRIDEVDVPVADIPLEFLKEFEAINAGRNEYAASTYDEADGSEYLSIIFNNPTLWL
jgi:aryl-alcohol dehydrogenase-like predicted oxidoreductase